MGVGNNHYAVKNLEGAAAAFAEATRLYPKAGDAFNNLAQVLLELHQHEAAEKAALRAVALGGPHESIYRQTLNQIKSGGENR